jgi:transposase
MNALYTPNELQVGIDVGSLNHSVAISDGNGKIIREFEISHTQKGFDEFFTIIARESKQRDATASIAMEGYNGWARPLDGLILKQGYKLYNVNNVKLARFKEIFPGAAKTDAIDARKIVELFSLQKHLPVAKKVLQEIQVSDSINIQLKKLTRRRKQLVEERMIITNRMGADLQAETPDLKALTSSVDDLWFLRFMTLKQDMRLLIKVHKSTIEKIPRIRKKHIDKITVWQAEASFTDAIDYIASMFYDDAMRILELKHKIKDIEKQIDHLIPSSKIASKLLSIPGFATVSAGTLAGEIGTLNLDNSSGKQKGSKRNMATNRHAKKAMINATMQHSRNAEESSIYLKKKISQGKKYQQAIRSLGRHLVRVIWSMIQQERDYEIREK